jgi:pimeloyl-ACP methyl ester carboxylesterase
MATQFFVRPEGTLAYSDYGGSGQPVLMLPGMGALRSEYRYLVPKLSAAGFRAVTVDLRGHGESSVPWRAYDIPAVGGDILALIEHLGAGPAHVIATSFSPGAAVWAAAERPAAIRSLVLIGAFVRPVKLNAFMSAGAWLLMHNPWRVRAWGMYYGTLYPTAKPADFQDYMRRLMENMAQPGRFDAAVALAECSRVPSAERLKDVQAPALVIMGTRDPDFPDPVAEGKYVAEQTGGRLDLVEGAGHYPQTEMPERTAPIVIDFLKRVASQSRAQGQEKRIEAQAENVVKQTG